MLSSKRRYTAALVAVMSWPAAGADAFDDWLARLVAFEGRVESRLARGRQWQAAALDERFSGGDRVRTRERSRASLQLRNENFLSLDQNTVTNFGEPKSGQMSWLTLLTGKILFRSRIPDSFRFWTPFVNGVHRGTEFLVDVRDDATVVTVYDGRVDARNEFGAISIRKGQSAIARRGEAPRLYTLVKPEDAVEWAIYYPPVIEFAALQRLPKTPEIRQALVRYERNDTPGALDILDALPPNRRPPGFYTLRAGLLLTVGRVDEAVPDIRQALQQNAEDATALAQLSVVAVARNDNDEALLLARQAMAADPRSSSAKLALSYALQSRFALEDARAVIRAAAENDPDNTLILARLSELELSLGSIRRAEEAAARALRINPRQARARSLLGFAKLMRMETQAAMEAFSQAVADEPTDPVARFGLGLANIRRGKLQEGTEDIEFAATLSPADPLIRSYLGKAYYEQKRSAPAAAEYALAKELDPKDPTPFFYSAIKKQTENRPAEGLRDLEKAIELNENRAIYRSKLMLDSDLAARSAALGRIYNDLGFGQRALVEGWKSVNTDPSDYSSHRFLADNYANLPRHEIARVSELLQSQLLQPINLTPVQPHLAETNLLLLGGLGPSRFSFNEFNPLFQRNRMALQASGVVGTNSTVGDEVTQSGVWNNFSYSLGQFHYETDGFRANNGLSENLYNGFAQWAIAPGFSVQFEGRHRDSSFGDLAFNFDLASPDTVTRTKLSADTFRGGVHFAPNGNVDLLGSVIYLNETQENVPYEINASNNGLLSEGQAISRFDHFSLITGGGYYDATTKFDGSASAVEHGNVYLYSQIYFPKTVVWTVGGAYDSFRNFISSDDQLSPKVGVIWNVMPNTMLRAAYFKMVKRPLLTDQTIEPTQVAGFNQLYDDFNGTGSERYGIALDQKIDRDAYLGAEASWRMLSVPGQSRKPLPQQEDLYRAYVHWIPHRDFAVTANYELEYFDNDGQLYTETQMGNLGLRYFHPSGLIGRVHGSYINQSVTDVGHDGFMLVDLGIGFRLPKRYGILNFEVRNLLDQEFRFQDLDNRTSRVGDPPRFFPVRTFLAQFTLSF